LARELTYQLEHADLHGQLARVLATTTCFVEPWSEETKLDILMVWHRLDQRGYGALPFYEKVFESIPRGRPRKLMEPMARIMEIAEARGDWVFALAIGKESIALSEQLADVARLTEALRASGWIASLLGHLDESKILLLKSLDLAEA